MSLFSLFAVSAVIAYAHSGSASPLLLAMLPNGAGSCPFGQDSARSPLARESARHAIAMQLRGSPRASARPALGFVLDETTRAEVLRWAEEHALECSSSGRAADLECRGVPSAALPLGWARLDVDALWFQFGLQDELTSVSALRRTPDAAAVSTAFADTVGALDRGAGPAAEVVGDLGAEALSRGPLHQTRAEYRFRDYQARAVAGNLGDGFALTEEYRSLPEL